jgi:hypothetical protein
MIIVVKYLVGKPANANEINEVNEVKLCHLIRFNLSYLLTYLLKYQ